jgi:hypothetical protein
MKKKCVICGKEFEAGGRVKGCGVECRAEINRARAREKSRKKYAENKQKMLAKNRAWRAANPEKKRARERVRARERYAANPEKKRAQNRISYIRNQPRILERARERYAANPEKKLAQALAWQAANTEKVQVYKRAKDERQRRERMRMQRMILVDECVKTLKHGEKES